MKRVLVNEPVCMGCHLCEVYCQLQHSRSTDLIKAFKKESPRQLPRLRIEARNPVFFSLRCQHCTESHCIYACLTGALSRNTDTGAVIIDEEKCTGCWTCIITCPYGSIRPDTLRHKSVKCDLCQGAETPACVLHCPNEALVYEDTGDREGKVSRVEAPVLK
ncbi:MAG: 4Fe-4S dicluster domain-containing protein [Dehalococcoidia bacterium]|nr:4Fe-4S dicluster domain-containing protein [Dehalococcoidia bacterium]